MGITSSEQGPHHGPSNADGGGCGIRSLSRIRYDDPLMTRDEVIRRLRVSLHHAIWVAADAAEEFPGYVRSIYLQPDSLIRVEYEVHGFDEGGAYFVATYPSVDDAITALTVFLGRGLDDWSDLHETGEYVENVDKTRLNVGHKALAAAIRNGTIALPGGAEYTLQGCSYYKQFAGNRTFGRQP